jgi:hypothetical protein
MENNEQQHLELITEMIQTARKEFNDRSFIYLIWGWAVCIASIGQYVLIKMENRYNYMAWAVLMPLAAIVQIVVLARKQKQERVSTYVDKVSGYLWTAVGMSLGIVLFSQNSLQMCTFPVVIVLYGIGTFVSGGLMDLKPMIAGGICCWVIAFVAFYVNINHQLLLLALSVILSYIIPGYVLKSRFNKNV